MMILLKIMSTECIIFDYAKVEVEAKKKRKKKKKKADNLIAERDGRE